MKLESLDLPGLFVDVQLTQNALNSGTHGVQLLSHVHMLLVTS
jgi:hypothetical protein